MHDDEHVQLGDSILLTDPSYYTSDSYGYGTYGSDTSDDLMKLSDHFYFGNYVRNHEFLTLVVVARFKPDFHR